MNGDALTDAKLFISSGFSKDRFTDRLYRQIYLHMGFIAHYDRWTFFEYYWGAGNHQGPFEFLDELRSYQRIWGYGDGKDKDLHEDILKEWEKWYASIPRITFDAEFMDWWSKQDADFRSHFADISLKFVERIWLGGATCIISKSQKNAECDAPIAG